MIDEKKMIEVLKNNMNRNGRIFIDLETLIRMIEDMPKVGEWIPCDVGAPEYNEDVEVTTKNGERQIGYYAGGCWYDSINGDYIQIIAWKEPSEPWEEGK